PPRTPLFPYTTLFRSTADLDEVVVVGYGSQQKKDVTGSIAPVSMTNVRGQSIASLDQGLSGQVAGVNVSTSNGTPGGGPKIQVRSEEHTSELQSRENL